MFSKQEIKFVEVEVLDFTSKADKEPEKGLLSNFNSISKSLRIIIDVKKSSLYANLAFYNIVHIKVALIGTEEDLFYTESAEDQKKAYHVLCQIVDQLKHEGKITASGFVIQDKYTNIPNKYLSPNFINSKVTRIFNGSNTRDTVLGSVPNTKAITTVGNPTITSTPNTTTRVVSRVKTVTFIKRRSKLPTGEQLALMRSSAGKISSGDLKIVLPLPIITLDDLVVESASKERTFSAEEVKDRMSNMNNFNPM